MTRRELTPPSIRRLFLVRIVESEYACPCIISASRSGRIVWSVRVISLRSLEIVQYHVEDMETTNDKAF